MDINSLPDDVLRLVLKRSLKGYDIFGRFQSADLQLLAVCQRWRRLVLPAVYEKVVIRYGARPRRGEASVEKTEIRSSVDLIASAGCVHTIKAVEIAINHLTSPFTGLTAVIQLMRSAAETWEGVRALKLSLRSYSESADMDDSSAYEYEDDIKKACAALTSVMPGVREVSFWGDYGVVAWELDGQLTVLYASQLEALKSQHSINLPANCVLGELRELQYDFNSFSPYILPRADPAKLVKLYLSDWVANHSWTPLLGDDSPWDVEFPSMEELYVSYEGVVDKDGAQHPDGHPWKFHFPRLKRLTVYSMESICPLLEYAVLPASLDKMTIGLHESLFSSLLEMRLPAARRVEVGIQGWSTGGRNIMTTINRVLERVQGSERTGLCLNSGGIPVLPESITFTALTGLMFYAETSVDTIVGLIRNLPRLTSLEIFRATFDNVQMDLSIPGPDDDSLAEPFDTKIEYMRLGVDFCNPVPETGMQAVKHLLLKIPTLKALTAWDFPERPVTEFATAYSKRYPHLARIAMRLRKTPRTD